MSTSRPGRKRLAFLAITLLGVAVVVLSIGEVVIRTFRPSASLYPGLVFSPRYGHALPRNAQMVHEMPGHWRFVYRINEHGYRGPAVSASAQRDASNIVVLGDSNSFGIGVDEGQQYPAVLDRELGEDYRLFNLSAGGYSLPQQIRWFYDSSASEKPTAVILQFSPNDPREAAAFPVTRFEDGRFVFAEVRQQNAWLISLVSSRWLQTSQLYSYLRKVVMTRRAPGEAHGEAGASPAAEDYYTDLLVAFTRDLQRRGIRVILIPVRDVDFQDFPKIDATISNLHDRGALERFRVDPWIDDPARYPKSPEGHRWGEAAHARLAAELADLLRGTRR